MSDSVEIPCPQTGDGLAVGRRKTGVHGRSHTRAKERERESERGERAYRRGHTAAIARVFAALIASGHSFDFSVLRTGDQGGLRGGETKGGGVILRGRGGRTTAGGVAHVLQESPHARVALQPVLVLPVGVTEKRQSSTRARATAATGECPRDARAGDRAPRPPGNHGSIRHTPPDPGAFEYVGGGGRSHLGRLPGHLQVPSGPESA